MPVGYIRGAVSAAETFEDVIAYVVMACATLVTFSAKAATCFD
jgi:hypothetical protein